MLQPPFHKLLIRSTSLSSPVSLVAADFTTMFHSGCRRSSLAKHFTSREIEKATCGFSTIIFPGLLQGTLYKACLPGISGCHAAVLRVSPQEKLPDDEFRREAQLLSHLHHRHVLRVLGFSTGKIRSLIFDHMAAGTLKQCLHDPLRTPLTWRERLRIAVEVAAALEYLYYFCEPPLLDVVVTSEDVMLDADYVAKVLVLGRLRHNSSSHLTNDDRAFSQERSPHRKRTESYTRVDGVEERRREVVVRYGALVLELVTGQSSNGDGETVRWIQGESFASSLDMMVDADLGNSDEEELRRLLVVARLCMKVDMPAVTLPQVRRYLQRQIETS